MESTKRIATATWVVIVLYLFASRFIRLLIGPVIADVLVFFLAVLGLIVAIICLFLVPKYGRKGILIPAIVGLLLNALVLGIWIPNFLAARARARSTRPHSDRARLSIARNSAVTSTYAWPSLCDLCVSVVR